ncbi:MULTISPECIES: hypothetical protein [Enterobacteriaceae]|nr:MULTISPECIES: hypothetical protein [Enterobacteriaceae]MBQ5076150.1 hypothetical protein [Klebsiella pneumoniae]MBZ2228283.1 hypothetical protein [Escherichia coli]MBZ2242086.1 hypothetical protein [Escherichia coli]MBZ2246597.1 hypothetical protein [Escherichia coli]MBZ2251107.1 hypothetical protein [Escherichia coli]
MDSEEPPNVRVACSGDIDEVVRLMHDAAAWMSAKGTPAWDVARIDRTFAETFVLRSELLGEHKKYWGSVSYAAIAGPFPSL